MATATKSKIKVPRSNAPEIEKPSTTPQTTVTQAVSTGIAFSASQYQPSNLWELSESIPSLNEAEFSQRLEKIKGQQRSVAIVQENLKLINGLLKAEGLGIDNQVISKGNEGKMIDLQSAGVKVEQSQSKLSIEQSKLAALNHDVSGYASEAQIKG